MAEVFGEWRRGGSPCRRRPRAVAARPRRRCRLGRTRPPRAAQGGVLTTSDGYSSRSPYGPRTRAWAVSSPTSRTMVPSRCQPELRVRLYRDLETVVEEARKPSTLLPHSFLDRDLEAILGRFVDAAWAYRFGPPGHDVIVVTLERPGEQARKCSRRRSAFQPVGRCPGSRIGSLGLAATATRTADGQAVVSDHESAARLRSSDPRRRPDPGRRRVLGRPGDAREVLSRPTDGDATAGGGTLTALNLDGQRRDPVVGGRPVTAPAATQAALSRHRTRPGLRDVPSGGGRFPAAGAVFSSRPRGAGMR